MGVGEALVELHLNSTSVRFMRSSPFSVLGIPRCQKPNCSVSGWTSTRLGNLAGRTYCAEKWSRHPTDVLGGATHKLRLPRVGLSTTFGYAVPRTIVHPSFPGWSSAIPGLKKSGCVATLRYGKEHLASAVLLSPGSFAEADRIMLVMSKTRVEINFQVNQSPHRLAAGLRGDS